MTLLELVDELKKLPQDDAHEIWCIPVPSYREFPRRFFGSSEKFEFCVESKLKDEVVYLKDYNPSATKRYRMDFFIYSGIAKLPMAQYMIEQECRHRAAKALHGLQHAHPRSVIRMKAWERTEVALGIRFRCDIEIYGWGKE